MASSTKVQGLTIGASVVVHAALATLLSWWALGSFSARPVTKATEPGTPGSASAAATSLAIDLPSVGEGVLVEDDRVDPRGEPPRPAGGATIARVDSLSQGRGGEPETSAPALNFADRDDQMRLSPDLLSRLDRDQLQRLRVDRARQSWEDRRSTTHPAELTLVVTGTGARLERRPDATSEPNRGSLQSAAASVRGGEVGTTPSRDASPDPERARGGAQAGSTVGLPGLGVSEAQVGTDHRASAPIARARPDVTQAAVAIPSLDPARPRDNVDTDQEVATTVRSLVHASAAGGQTGEGQGGSAGAGEAGAGGARGAGSRARPLGIGEGDIFDYWTTDPRLLPYFRRLHARIDPLWANAFPRSALLDLRQGTVILEFTVGADGRVSVSWPPVRPSGIDEFDRNCADALRRASPLPPIPRELGVTSLRVRAPFVVDNPIVK